jgi:hypothetical protein
MNEELMEKLIAILGEKGIDEATTKEIVVELAEKPEEGENPEETEPKEAEEAKEKDPEEKVEAKPEEGEAPKEETPDQSPAPAEEVPPEQPEAPQIDIEAISKAFDEMSAKVEEMGKANEALLNRIGSLEDALKQAGVIEGGVAEFGYDSPKAPANDPSGDGLDGFLAQVNRRSY